MTSSGTGARFGFGSNWRDFLSVLDEDRVQEAESSLVHTLARSHLDGLRFCDVGCGSGLFSLAARRLGATVHSFDFDPGSVACTTELKRRFFPDDPRWTVERGDVLDDRYLASLGTFDVVYAWGVLHHTGDMWRAMESISGAVRDGGVLWLAIYNDQGWRSSLWRRVKQLYNVLPARLRLMVVLPALVRLWGPTTIRDLVRRRPFESWHTYRSQRGMSAWHDVVDWIGGYPFEVARPTAVTAFYRRLGFRGDVTVRRAGLGCNEFVFRRAEYAASERA